MDESLSSFLSHLRDEKLRARIDGTAFVILYESSLCENLEESIYIEKSFLHFIMNF
jgi:hypothetical protein